jgi:hypothetical protein
VCYVPFGIVSHDEGRQRSTVAGITIALCDIFVSKSHPMSQISL